MSAKLLAHFHCTAAIIDSILIVTKHSVGRPGTCAGGIPWLFVGICTGLAGIPFDYLLSGFVVVASAVDVFALVEGSVAYSMPAVWIAAGDGSKGSDQIIKMGGRSNRHVSAGGESGQKDRTVAGWRSVRRYGLPYYCFYIR